jgi:hypothetical protein
MKRSDASALIGYVVNINTDKHFDLSGPLSNLSSNCLQI